LWLSAILLASRAGCPKGHITANAPPNTLRHGRVPVTPSIEGECIVERGVVLGGLMICGSFLLAVMLNRSAMEEVPAPAPAPLVVQPVATPSVTDCAEANTRTDANGMAIETEPPAADLMVNGREACPR